MREFHQVSKKRSALVSVALAVGCGFLVIAACAGRVAQTSSITDETDRGTYKPSVAQAPSAWEQARPLYVALTPLWWTGNRMEGLMVQALHNDEELAIRLSWLDPTLDNRAVRHDEFRDGVAIQFSLSSDPPFYMGDPGEHGGVNIWYWKADRGRDIASGYQDVDSAFPDRAVDMYPEQEAPSARATFMAWPRATLAKHDRQFVTAWGAGNFVANPNLKTPVESLVARGPGTLAVRIGWEEAYRYIAKAHVAIARRYSGESGARKLRAQGYPEEMIEETGEVYLAHDTKLDRSRIRG